MAIEHIDQFIHAFEAGESIPIASVSELTDAENVLVHELLPLNIDVIPQDLIELYYPDWQNRPRLTEMIRNKGFNGTFKDISITRLENPYEELLKERKPPKFSSDTLGVATTIGFTLLAHLASTAGGTPVQTEKRVWLIQNQEKSKIMSSGLWRRIISDERQQRNSWKRK